MGLDVPPQALTLMARTLSFRSCYMVFPCLQVALGLSCLMGLVMFACYGGNSPLDKQYITSKDQVSIALFYLFTIGPTVYLSFFSTLCDTSQ